MTDSNSDYSTSVNSRGNPPGIHGIFVFPLEYWSSLLQQYIWINDQTHIPLFDHTRTHAHSCHDVEQNFTFHVKDTLDILWQLIQNLLTDKTCMSLVIFWLHFHWAFLSFKYMVQIYQGIRCDVFDHWTMWVVDHIMRFSQLIKNILKYFKIFLKCF